MTTVPYQTRLRQLIAVTGLIVAAMPLFAATAHAGACPAGKQTPVANFAGATEPKGVSDNVLASIDLAKEAVKLDDRQFRLRRLEVKPGGIVPTHSHADRPALIYIVQGSITEYSSKCSVPIEHKAGEAAMESIGLSHWWRNNGKKTVVLLSADILHMKTDDGHMM